MVVLMSRTDMIVKKVTHGTGQNVRMAARATDSSYSSIE